MTTDRLNPTLCTVAQLFSDQTTYRIPIYQRNYAWRAEQIEQLISDVVDAMLDGDDEYFLGNLIVTRRSSATADFEVIDGQQRLTTLYLILACLTGRGKKTPASAPIHQVLYESRPRATEALRRLDIEEAAGSAGLSPSDFRDDSGIHEGYNVVRQYLNQHSNIDRDAFADYLRYQVTLVRASLPTHTDLNRYFEVMNTRGQQLQQVDIVKARLMSRLGDDHQRACFAWIWDACSDMDSYVQMALTPKDPRLRDRIFGETWSWLSITDFNGLWAARTSADSHSPSSRTVVVSMSLDEALAKYSATGTSEPDDDDDNVRFRSTIEFPALLLHVLRIVNHEDEDELEGHLDDKRLIKRFDDAVAGKDDTWVQSFAVELLRYRNLFDAFILKRQYTGTTGEDGDWSLQRLVRRRSKGRPTPGYANTFSAAGTDEDDGTIDESTNDLLLLESMLRITYTSPRTMHWITRLLGALSGRQPSAVAHLELADTMREYARGKVREAFFAGEEPQGFSINRIVFTYLDYLLLSDSPRTDFRFSFRNSIEHFYPQHPDETQSGVAVSGENLNLLGNLALVSVSANSKFSNSLPKAKAENYQATIEKQSPKLHLMAEITRDGRWDDAQVLTHHEAMVATLRKDCAEPFRT